MILALVARASLAQDDPPAAVLLAEDRLELGATALAPSPDGEVVLVYGPERAVVTPVDGPPGVVLEDLEGVVAGAVADSGRVALAHDGGVTVHGPTGKEELRLGGFGRVTGLALSPDGRWLAVASTRGLALHDAVDGRLAWSHDDPADGVAFTPAGRAVVATTGDQVRAFGLAKGSELRDASATPVPGFLPAGCAADPGPCPVPGAPAYVRGDRLLVVHDGALERWRVPTAGEVTPVPLEAAPLDAEWAGSDVVVVLEDGRLRRLRDSGAPGLDVVAPGCGAGCALAGAGGLGDETWVVGPGGAQRWDVGGAPLVKRPKPLGQVAVDRLDDGRFVSLGEDGRLRVGEAPGQGRVVGALAGAVGADGAGDVVVAWSPEGLLVAGADGGARSAPSLGPGRAPAAVALSPDGARIAVIDDQGALHVYRAADGSGELGLPLGLAGHAISWSAEGDRLIAAKDDIRVFSASDGEELATVVLGAEVRSVQVSSAGELLARTADRVVTMAPGLLD